MRKGNHVLVFILAVGVFGILNTEMGVIGILPAIADHFHISIAKAGWLVSLFALVVAGAGPTMPLLFSGVDRKKVMLLVLGVFVLGNVVSIFTSSFTVLLLARIIPAFFHPVYCSLAFSVAAASVSKAEAPKAVARVFVGVSAGMVAGVPIASFIASAVSLQAAMAFFAVVNIIVFLATWAAVPSMPVTERLSYGSQFSVLKKSLTWLSILTVILLNAAIFGVYSYLADYLKTVTHMPASLASFALFVYGGANIIGNMVGGRLLSANANKFVAAFPFVLVGLYTLLFLFGQYSLPMLAITFIWGILGGIGGNINQYWVTSAASEAPDFANGLFISACNVGTTLGAAAGGLLVSGLGTGYVVFLGILAAVLGWVTIRVRNNMYSPVKQLSA
ncbi:MFS transporter [Ectobacillus ponti]|uniref:MFS transporter n=1 Tax=Ectobacillus ponti TaxID=2961894 RepID=A0AA41X7B8_9BACI|nr:MFS transporter [Ectobacillus ponti]MCP8970072.1 MFS transporter [Ectobacillus ponti]